MRRSIALAVALLTMVSGCTTIATSGPVEEVPMAAQPRGIDIAPKPPTPDMTPERLVDGFLQAMADPEGGYAVARQYLTAGAAAEWEPVEAIIFDGEVAADAESAALVGQRIGSLDESYRFESDAEPLDHDFGLVLEQDQWRIDNPAERLMLSRYNFERYYSHVSLYFVSRAGAHVVPDPIHLPESLVTPTNLLEALFEGPPEELRGAVHDAVPDGTELGEGGATIDQAGIVTADLVGLPADLEDDELRRLGAQLLWTLTAIPRFTGLTVIQGARALPIPGISASGVLELATQQGYQVLSRASATDLYGVRRGRVGRISGADVFEVIPGVPQPAADVAVAVDGATMAVITEDRTELQMGTPNGPVEPVELKLSNLRSPQFVLGVLWLMGDDWTGTPRLATVDRRGVAQVIDLEEGLGRMRSFSVAPSRARIAIVADVRGRDTLGIATVAGSTTISVGGWQPLEMTAQPGGTLSEAVSPVWQAETSLALAASQSTGRSMFTTMLDGSLVQDIGSVSGEVVDIAANVRLGGGPVAVTTAQGVVWRYDPRTRWSSSVEDVSAVAYPG